MGDSSITPGEDVYDIETSTYKVVEVIDTKASEYIAKEEVKERGHVIYEAKTVADQNPQYPADDKVVRLKRNSDGKEVLWPLSRVVSDINNALKTS